MRTTETRSVWKRDDFRKRYDALRRYRDLSAVEIGGGLDKAQISIKKMLSGAMPVSRETEQRMRRMLLEAAQHFNTKPVEEEGVLGKFEEDLFAVLQGYFQELGEN
jgi:hypothetical protein